MSLDPFLSKTDIESRAFYAARRIFGRYGVDASDSSTTPKLLRAAMKRMTTKEYTCIIGAFASVMKINGRMLPPAPTSLTEVQMYDKLQTRARHLAHHPEDLPKAAS